MTVEVKGCQIRIVRCNLMARNGYFSLLMSPFVCKQATARTADASQPVYSAPVP
jgi:hypothetical protein